MSLRVWAWPRNCCVECARSSLHEHGEFPPGVAMVKSWPDRPTLTREDFTLRLSYAHLWIVVGRGCCRGLIPRTVPAPCTTERPPVYRRRSRERASSGRSFLAGGASGLRSPELHIQLRRLFTGHSVGRHAIRISRQGFGCGDPGDRESRDHHRTGFDGIGCPAESPEPRQAVCHTSARTGPAYHDSASGADSARRNAMRLDHHKSRSSRRSGDSAIPGRGHTRSARRHGALRRVGERRQHGGHGITWLVRPVRKLQNSG